MPTTNPNMLFIDIETTGLDPQEEIILEVGLSLVDPGLNVIDDISHVIKIADTLPESCGKIVQDMHTKSGLWDDCINNGLDGREVENLLVEWLRGKGYEPQSSPWCGSSVSFDRGFIEPDMPKLAAEFHYRQIDVSTVKELCRRFNPRVFEFLPEPDIKAHRVLSDLRWSIAELKYYTDNFLFVDFLEPA